MEHAAGPVRTVLVVDDDPKMRRFLGVALAGEPGLRLLVAADGPAALAVAAAERVDLVLLDLAMPGMDGLAVCRALKALPPDRRPAVLMFTAQATPHDRAGAEAAGADGFLAKPVGVQALRGAVQDLLS